MSWVLSTLMLAAALAPTAQPSEIAQAERAALPAPRTADELFAQLQELTGFEAVFHEEKQISLLAAPVVHDGKLYYLRPGYLTRVVEAPQRAVTMIRPGRIEVRKEGTVERIDLTARPDIRVFVESFVRVVAGDAEALERVYALVFNALDAGEWTLELIPRGEPLSVMIRQVTLRGVGPQIESIRIDEPNGDFSVIRISDVQPQRVFTPEERLRWFGLPATP